jgi:hypothetical protein
MKIWEKIKPVIEAIKAAKTLYSIILILLAYTGYNEANKLVNVPVKAVETTVEPIKIVEKDWLPVIRKECEIIAKKECRKSDKSHSDRQHGGS